MSRKRTDYRVAPIEDVAKQVHNADAQRAAKAFYALRDAGKSPTIWYSEFHGYRVTEDSLLPGTRLPGRER